MSTQLAPAPAGRIARLRNGLSRGEWVKLGGMSAVIVALHIIGWFIMIALVVPHHYSLGTKTFGLGIGLTAYTLGMRHAFDADHNRRDRQHHPQADGRRQTADVGRVLLFPRPLEHRVRARVPAFPRRQGAGRTGAERRSNLHHYTGLIGTSVSGTFLFTIAAINVIILVGILKVFRDMRRGVYDETTLEEHLNNRGLMNRILRPIMKSINKPGQMYGVGLLFGLGFDTASEVALLVLAAAGAASALPWYAILCLPVLFAAGMCLFDTLDGTFMNIAYGWAFSKPVRKVFYNITITTLSVMVAFIIGGVELLGLLSQQLNITGRFWTDMQNADINTLGFIIVGLFVVIWRPRC